MTDSIDKVEETHGKVDMVKRDGETSIAVGLFVIALGLPVLIGTIWADRASAAIVNAISGIVLLLIGGGATLYGWVLYRRATRSVTK